MLTAEGLGGHTLNFPSPKRLFIVVLEKGGLTSILDRPTASAVKTSSSRLLKGGGGRLDLALGVVWGS